MPTPRRKILLSIRERPLPILWLLAFLAPYLLFNLAAVPHIHSGELAIHCGAKAQYQHSQISDVHDTHRAAECPLCHWTAGSHSSLITPQQITLDSSTTAQPALPVVTHTTPHFSVFDGRGPPLSL